MKSVKFGILGVSGHYNKRLALPLQNADLVSIVAIASRDKEKAENFAKKWNIPIHYGSYEDLLSNPTIDAVYIPLPNHLHAEWVKKAADAGKHILCEKPFALNVKETTVAIAYAESKGVKVMEAFMYRFQPQWQRAKELIKIDEIGKVVDIHTYFSYNNTDLTNFRNKETFGGGALYDIGCYAISVARYLLDAEPKRVISLINRDETNTDTVTSAILDFGTTRSTFTVSTRCFPFQRVEIIGTAGIITVNLPFNTFTDVPARLTVLNGLGTREIIFEPYDQFQLEFTAFAKAIINNSPVPTPPSDAINNMKVIDAIFRSEKTTNWEKI